MAARLWSPIAAGLGRLPQWQLSSAHLLAWVHASLQALRCDHLDLLLLHRPDLPIDPDAVAATFAELKAAGKVLAFGEDWYRVWQASMGHEVP